LLTQAFGDHDGQDIGRDIEDHGGK
jgi:hypothetical protein